MTTEKQIRIATTSDIPAMKLVLKSLDNPWNPAVLEDCFGRNYLQWVIEEDQAIIGFVTVHTSLENWEIMFIAVRPNYQKKNFASALLKYLINEAKLCKIKLLRLEVRKSNKAAISLYQKLNFKQVGIRNNYYSDGKNKEDALLLDLTIF